MQNAHGVPADLIARWRRKLALAAEITGAQLARLVAVTGPEAETLAAEGPGAAGCVIGERVTLEGSGLFIAGVAAARAPLVVQDASADPLWRGAPEVVRGLRAYCGLPILRLDGALFGVIDLADRVPRGFSAVHRRLFAEFRDTIQEDLRHVDGAAAPAPSDIDVETDRERLQLAAEINGLGVWDYDVDRGLLHCDANWYRIFGRDPAEPVVTLEALRPMLHPDDVPLVDAALAIPRSKRGAGDRDNHAAFRVVHPDGTMRRVSSVARFVPATPGRPNRLTGIVVDVTEAHEAEERLKRSLEALQQTEKLAGLGSWTWNVGTDLITWSETANALFGWDPAQPLPGYDGMAALFAPESWERLGPVVQACLESGEPYVIDMEAVRTDGSHFFVQARGQAARDASGKVTSLFGTILDITQRRAAEQAVAERERWLSDMVENLPAGAMLVKDGELLVNKAVEAMTGYSRDELSTREIWFERLFHDDAANRMRAYREHRARGFGDVAKVTYYRKDGEARRAEITPTLVKGDEIWLMRDITEQERLTDALSDEKERLVLATQAGGIGVFGVDFRERKITWDEQMYVLYGRRPGEFGGEFGDWGAILHPDDRDKMTRRWQAAIGTESFFEDEFRMVRPDGEVRHIRSHARLFQDDDGQPLRAVGVNWDSTNIHRSAEVLNAAKDAAEAAERAKSDFLATMSHEIRTPMNTVIGMTRLMLRTEVDAKQRNYLEKIDVSGKTLLAIINDILDFSKIEAGRLELEETEFTLEAVLESVSTVTAIKAEEKGIEIAFGIGAGVPRTLRGDPLRLSQVLINLVGNAVKFTDEGEVIVSVDIVGGDEAPALQFSVRDTGVGLDELRRRQLFRPFTQGDSETARRYGGTGLGLAISKQLVEMMGGRIEVDSRPGEGSTFRFTIALKGVQPAVSAREAIWGPRPLDGTRVLIVDDNATARAILTDMVAGFGMVVEAVSSGREALATLRAASAHDAPFALVLMDWRMPDMDGLETARHIRADASLAELPAILMVTAYGREEVLRRVDQLGLQGLLIKPVTESMMFNVIMNLFSEVPDSDLFGKPRPPAAVGNRSVLKDTLAILAGRRVLVVDDNALNREVASEFLTSVNMHVDAVASGEEALGALALANYDAVLMDVQMPGMDGPATTREIRRNPAWAHLPIVALTAQARVEDRETSLKAGMTAHLTKPVDEALLYKTLADIFAGVAAPGSLRNGAAGLRVAAGGGSKVDFGTALRLVGRDPNRLARLLAGFVKDFSETPGQLAVALSSDDLGEAAALAHRVKGPAGYLRADALVQLAADVEDAARDGAGDLAREHAVAFNRELETVLAAVRARIAEGPSPEAVDRKGADGRRSNGSLDALIDEAEPLVARGEFAAGAVLSRLAVAAKGDRQAALIEAIRGHFDDLELDAALAGLARLRAELSGTGDGAAT